MSLDEPLERLEKLVAEIRQASLTDDMTTLGNALALRREGRMLNAGSSDTYAVVFGDLNDFKHINDEHGHNAGDVALNKVGEVVSKVVIERFKAKAFRKSGDEFVMLFQGDLIDEFLSAPSSFNDILFSYNEKDLRTSMSLGCARSDGKTSFDDLLERAEVACQYAKSQDDSTCVEWSKNSDQTSLVRLQGRCPKCSARITCNVTMLNAPLNLKLCPCCGNALQRD